MIKALLLMGGKGERFGSSLPKQFHNISGKKIYLHTLDRFIESALFDEIILVCHPKWMKTVTQDLCHYESIRIVEGGKNRQVSSYLGLLACGKETDYVVIHDAVRPFVSREILEKNVDSVKRHCAVDTCIPSTDTLVHSQDRRQITSIPHRASYLRGQTPQSFSYPLILQAHQATGAKKATDDCSLVMELGKPIYIVFGDETNMKITTELDITLAEQLFFRQQRGIRSNLIRCLQGTKIALAGGTGGIGKAIENLLVEEGAISFIISRTSTPYRADFSSFTETKKVFDQLYFDHGALDGLVNCFGLFQVKDLQHTSSKELAHLIDVNVKGVIHACQCAKLKPASHIVNLASSSYCRGRKGYCVYSATKAAVVNFTQGFAEERPDLFINAIAPQRTNTPMREAFFPEEDPALRLSPERVAEEIIALLKQTSITGSVIEVRNSTLQLF